VTADFLAGFAEKLNDASSNLTPTGIEKPAPLWIRFT